MSMPRATLPVADDVWSRSRSDHRGCLAASSKQGSPREAMTKPALDWEGGWAPSLRCYCVIRIGSVEPRSSGQMKIAAISP